MRVKARDLGPAPPPQIEVEKNRPPSQMIDTSHTLFQSNLAQYNFQVVDRVIIIPIMAALLALPPTLITQISNKRRGRTHHSHFKFFRLSGRSADVLLSA
ncbi:hypothetical protein CPSG_04962 [Coccidioides posadasii str. Silveira]|uniref:Uncharacterized protein n=1 Tax=Coccidioides posadasii (strain RMSCC 757 / Silveira) TaxID=443226 RepID=E9D5T2_COCPS|nr:hypothetical protein CPSG_04962 [Coccidioides posadasii str. Silveira]